MHKLIASAVSCCCLLIVPAPAVAAEHASGEPSWSAPQPVQRWRSAAPAASAVARMDYGELGLDRLLQLQRAQGARAVKATPIGIPRRADLEAVHSALPPLQWRAAGAGGAAARIEVRSRDALALRVGLQVERLDDRVELRFAGSDSPARVTVMMRGAEVNALLDARGLFWTPSTDGEAQLIEIYRPAGVPAGAVRLQAPRLSHLMANSRNDFKIIEKIGESGSCNVDTSCRVAELGPHYVNAKNAVAHMQFVVDGSTYICTGTLLADTVAATQVPYFYGANHCFASGNGAPVASQMQTVANTLNTFWDYEATACGSGIEAARTQLAGGATYLYSDEQTDGMLLRLNNAPPAGAYFAGWTAAPLAAGIPITGIHHPRGDAKKVSLGQLEAIDGTQHRVGWLSGTTEGGSSGSALFTVGTDGYLLRGGLYGGQASCANTGALANAGNDDYYSRFDVLFPQVRAYLASDPLPMNGSRPLLPPVNLPASSPAASAAPPAAGPEVEIPRDRQGAHRAGVRPRPQR